MLKLYYSNCAVRLTSQLFNSYLQLVPLAIQQRILKFRRWQDAQACLYGKLLLKKGLKEFGLNEDLNALIYNEYGRPYLSGSLDFNISHSGDFVVCVFNPNGKIGVDVEEIKPIAVDDFEPHFDTDEWRDINNSTNIISAFYYYWTAKEAVAKAIGKGLSIPLNRIVIKDGCSKIAQSNWHLKPVNIGAGHIMQIASQKAIDEEFALVEVKFNE
jgi:4'-phosphopantetheinyl transferase